MSRSEARELRWALIRVQRAFEKRDRAALSNAPEALQPLVDAAMRWVTEAEQTQPPPPMASERHALMRWVYVDGGGDGPRVLLCEQHPRCDTQYTIHDDGGRVADLVDGWLHKWRVQRIEPVIVPALPVRSGQGGGLRTAPPLSPDVIVSQVSHLPPSSSQMWARAMAKPAFRQAVQELQALGDDGATAALGARDGD